MELFQSITKHHIALSGLPTLTIKDLVDHPNVVWHRNEINPQSEIIQHRDEVDRLGKRGCISLTGAWLSGPVDLTQILKQVSLPVYNQILSQNRTANSSLLVIDAFPEMDWDLDELSRRKGITLATIRKVAQYQNRRIPWDVLSACVDLTTITAKDRQAPWYRPQLSQNRTLTFAMTREIDTSWPNVKGRWCIFHLCRSSQVRLADIQLLDEIHTPTCLWDSLSRLWDILSHLKLPRTKTWWYGYWSNEPRWRRHFLSSNKMTVALMQAFDRSPHITGSWDMTALSNTIPIDDIIDHHEMAWERASIIRRKAVDVDRWYRAQPQHVLNDLSGRELGEVIEKLSPTTLYRYSHRHWGLISLARNRNGVTLRDIGVLYPDPQVRSRVGLTVPTDHKLQYTVDYVDIVVVARP
jgi:hypothetical protein